MGDMLVRLYDLPLLDPVLAAQHAEGIDIRRALAPEKHLVTQWVAAHFSAFWQSETEVAFAAQPATIFIATQAQQLIGFAAYDVVRKAMFGPTGVAESARGKGTGKALLLAALHAMWWDGYAYGIIGGVGPAEFYEKAVGATLIAGSDPGIYRGMLKK